MGVYQNGTRSFIMYSLVIYACLGRKQAFASGKAWEETGNTGVVSSKFRKASDILGKTRQLLMSGLVDMFVFSFT